MKGKQLLLLLLALAVLGGAGYYLQKGNQSAWSNSGGGSGGKVVEFPINDVAQVHIKSAAGELNVVKKNDDWVVQERADYPANFEQVSGLVRKLWELKTVQEVKVGPSQMPRLELAEPGAAEGAGTLVEFKDKDGRSVGGVLLGKKHTRKSDSPSPMGDMGGMGGFATGRYIMPLGGKKVSLVSETLDEVEAKPERWLRKDFIKVENPKSIAVAGETPGMQWMLVRDSAAGDWKFADAQPAASGDSGKPAETKPAAAAQSDAATKPPVAAPEAKQPDAKAAAPADAKPAESKAGEPAPAAEGSPCDVQAAEPPADAKPADAKPADTKPVDAKPADPKPADASPAKPDSTPAQPLQAPPASAPTPASPAAAPGASPTPGEAKLSAPTTPELDKSKVSQFGSLLTSPSFKDVLGTDAKAEEIGLDKPTTVTIETFDRFTYTLQIGKLTNDAYPVNFTVTADLSKERTPGADEKPEDKTRLDEEFKTTQKRLEEKLASEKKLEGRTYLLEKFTVEPLLKERSALLTDAKPEGAAASGAPNPASPGSASSAATPPISVTTPPISVTTPPVSAPPASKAPAAPAAPAKGSDAPATPPAAASPEKAAGEPEKQ